MRLLFFLSTSLVLSVASLLILALSAEATDDNCQQDKDCPAIACFAPPCPEPACVDGVCSIGDLNNPECVTDEQCEDPDYCGGGDDERPCTVTAVCFAGQCELQPIASDNNDEDQNQGQEDQTVADSNSEQNNNNNNHNAQTCKSDRDCPTIMCVVAPCPEAACIDGVCGIGELNNPECVSDDNCPVTDCVSLNSCDAEICSAGKCVTTLNEGEGEREENTAIDPEELVCGTHTCTPGDICCNVACGSFCVANSSFCNEQGCLENDTTTKPPNNDSATLGDNELVTSTLPCNQTSDCPLLHCNNPRCTILECDTMNGVCVKVESCGTNHTCGIGEFCCNPFCHICTTTINNETCSNQVCNDGANMTHDGGMFMVGKDSNAEGTASHDGNDNIVSDEIEILSSSRRQHSTKMSLLAGWAALILSS